ncbi:ABC transporter permease [Catellatospora paridis]|uniref:ABC transporter permease n=1 Tax=Catellatospora paridis TaxID=1617086 RepID=UPI0012D38202|nr:FtsX-like permease family protein [Catellatospora paridis]
MLGRRRANSARGLLTAVAAAVLISTTLLTALAAYSGAVIEAGGRAAVAAAPAEERAVQVRFPSRPAGSGSWSTGTSGKGDLAEQWTATDARVRQTFAARFGDAEPEVTAAGYATGARFAGDTGKAVHDGYGAVYARVMFLDELADHARLVSGSWAVPGAHPRQVVVGEAAAQTLGLRTGSVVPLANGVSKHTEQVVVSGVFAATAAADPYWLLAPETAQGAEAGRNTYGPLVLTREDFFDGWAELGSNAWVVTPNLSGAEPATLAAARETVRHLADVPTQLGYGNGGQVSTHVERLVDRIRQASLVGRSDLLTPLLLIAILGGYALLLLAAMLTEGRRQETALLRARGASRAQLAGLATREALLVAAPAAVIAPLLTAGLLKSAGRLPMLSAVHLNLTPGITLTTVSVAAAAGLGCVLAMLLPALRGGGTYVADLATRSRPGRVAVAQRTGLDLALVGFAVLAWYQLRHYDSPLSGAGGRLGVDPLLAAAAPLGVLAGAVVALRTFPLLTRLLERAVDRTGWFAAHLGVWQAGRRPSAGPVLLLALSVAVSTLAWTLAATARQSQVDQADHTTGADLRLTETSPVIPAQRSAQVAGLPGVTEALPAWRTSLQAGERDTTASVVALDAAAAGDVLRLRADVGDAPTLLAGMAAAGSRVAGVTLPAGTTAVRGTVRITVDGHNWDGDPRKATAIQLTDEHGDTRTVPLTPAKGRHAFTAPVSGGPGIRLTGITVDGPELPLLTRISWALSGLSAVNSTGAATAISLDASTEPWSLAAGRPGYKAAAQGSGIRVDAWLDEPAAEYDNFAFTTRPQAAVKPVPALATPEALAALHTETGQTLNLQLWSQPVPIQVTGTLRALPGGGEPAALLLDMPSLSAHLQHDGLRAPNVTEWWAATDPARHAEAAAAAAQLPTLAVVDRQELARRAGNDPFGVGGRLALFIAALGAICLALVGIAVDLRSTARRRASELAVLNTLGASPGLLSRALMIEQAFLAGLGVTVGLLVGLLVARTTGPLVILTPSADRPVPPALTTTDWPPVLATAAVLLAITLVMAGLVATSSRRRLAATQLRIGADR